MSIWTSEVGSNLSVAARAAGALLLLVSLPTQAAAAPSQTTAQSQRPAASKVSVSEPAVVITGPSGYCIDVDASRQRGAEAFVLLGSCAAITQDPGLREPEVRAVLTATVSGLGEGYTIAQSLPVLDRFFRSEDGLRVLSRDGRAETVEVLETRSEGNVFYVRSRDTGTRTAPELGEDYWRAFFDVAGHIVSATVAGTRHQPVAERDSFSVLKSFVGKISHAN